ncbi:hypothetical protein EB093_00930 [bacterium]|nr:hypothetical protein [bacterium]
MSQNTPTNNRIKWIVAIAVVAALAWWQFRPTPTAPLQVSAVSQGETSGTTIVRLLIHIPNPTQSNDTYAVVITPPFSGMRVTAPGMSPIRRGHPHIVTAFLEFQGSPPQTPMTVSLISLPSNQLIGKSNKFSIGHSHK